MPQAAVDATADLSVVAAGWSASDPALAAALASSPSPVVALTRFGLDRYAAGDLARAAEIFSAVTRAAPGEALAWNNLALAEAALGRNDQAVVAWQTSLALDPAQQAIWTSLAAALLQSGILDDAEAAAVQAIALDARDGAPWQVRALARAGRQDFAGAAAAFARAMDLAGETATLRANLGTMLFQCGRFHEASDNFARAVELEPASDPAADMRRLADFVIAAIDGNMEAACRVYAGRPADMDLVYKTALLYLDRAGQRNAAVKVAEAWVAESPDNVEARHLRDSAQAKTIDRMPAELVTKHFDALADAFDDRLVGKLDYDGPQHIAALLARRLEPAETMSVLDAGCGSGLCAEILRPYARHLEGVDLSHKMIVRARKRGLYDRVGTIDLMSVLGRDRARWDLIVAADAMPYFGSLEPIFAGAFVALKPGGWLAFSTESLPGDDFVLRGSGRHAHSAGYIAWLAESRFEIVERIETMLRREGGRPIDGDYFLLRRLPDAD